MSHPSGCANVWLHPVYPVPVLRQILPPLLLLFLLASCADPARTNRCVITDHGAVGDGQTLNTKAIQTAIDECAATGGGTLVVPKGTFLTGALYFKQGVNLLIEKDGVLKSTTHMADFPAVYTRWEGIERYWTPALLNFIGMTNVTVSGDGLIDGSGENWPRLTRGGGRGFGRGGQFSGNGTGNNTLGDNSTATTPGSFANTAPTGPLPKVADAYPSPLPRTDVISLAPDPAHLPIINAAGIALPRGGGLAPPRTLVFQNCRKVRVSGIHVLNEARWGVVFIYTDDAVARNLTIRNPEHNIPSSDCMDIDSCRRVLVTGCYFECDDDCLSIKSGKDEDGRRVNRPSEDITIENTHFAFGEGGAAMGSETSGGIRRVLIRDCQFTDGNWAPIRFKSQPSRGGVVEDITYSNITLSNTRQAVEFNLDWSPRLSNGAAPAQVLPVVRNVKIINVSGTVRSVGVIHGLPGSPIENVVFQNCNITAQTGLTITNARHLDLSGLHLTVANGDPLTQTNVQ
jgi:polygalacturonase